MTISSRISFPVLSPSALGGEMAQRARIPCLIRLLPLALALSTALSGLAHAQVATPGISGSPGLGGAGGGGATAGSKADDKPVLAPALPGSISTTDSIAPPSRPAAEMSPNDALFDAIERGDQVAARDALARGARLDARDVLGETPLELSIDLGRNPITFTLLSMRGAAEDTQDSDAQPLPPTAAPSRSASIGSAGGKPTPGGQRLAATQQISFHGVPISGGAGDTGPAVFAGTPDLAMGFLGFAVPH